MTLCSLSLDLSIFLTPHHLIFFSPSSCLVTPMVLETILMLYQPLCLTLKLLLIHLIAHLIFYIVTLRISGTVEVSTWAISSLLQILWRQFKRHPWTILILECQEMHLNAFAIHCVNNLVSCSIKTSHILITEQLILWQISLAWVLLTAEPLSFALFTFWYQNNFWNIWKYLSR